MDDASDSAVDSFTLGDLTGWDDCECATYADDAPAWWGRPPPAKSSAKKLASKLNGSNKSKDTADIQRLMSEAMSKATRRLSATQSLNTLPPTGVAPTTSILMPCTSLSDDDAPPPTMAFMTAAFSSSAGTVLEPVNGLPGVKDPISPLAKPFTVYKYTPHKLQGHRRPEVHIVTSSADAEVVDSRPPSDDHLPPLTSLGDSLGGGSTSTKMTQRLILEGPRETKGPRRQQSAWHRPQADPAKLMSTRTPWDRTHPKQRVIQSGTPHRTTPKPLCKNDKPTLAMCRRRLSLVTTDTPDSGDSSYFSSPLYALCAPRRQSLSHASEPNVYEEEGDEEGARLARRYEATALSVASAITQTLTCFASPTVGHP